MKKTVLLLTLMACATGVFAQGTVVFNNRVPGTLVAPVYGQFAGDAFREQTGQSSIGVPAGGIDYTGAPLLAGTGFTAELWGGPVGALVLTPSPTGRSTFRTGTAAGAWTAIVPDPAINGALLNQNGDVVIRAWENRGGTITSWAQVLADNSIARGESPRITVGPLGGGTTPSPVLTGLVSFNIHQVVPEPSLIALGALGLGALLFRRRKQS